MTYRKITITLLLCCFNLLGFGQLSQYKIDTCQYKYGIVKKRDWGSGNDIQIVPPLFTYLSEFNKYGLSLAMRTIPLVFASRDGKIFINLNSKYPDNYLSNYNISKVAYNGEYNIYLTYEKDTQSYKYGGITPEEVMAHPTLKNYMDSMGNYYQNIFPEIDSVLYGNYTVGTIDLYGLIDTNGKIVQPLVYRSIAISNSSIYPFINHNKVGFMDSAGKISINPVYDNYEKCNNVYYSYRMYYEGDLGEFYNFTDNLCKVLLNCKLGIMDIKGSVIIPIEYKLINYEYYNYDYPRKVYKIHTLDFKDNKQVFDRNGKEIKE